MTVVQKVEAKAIAFISSRGGSGATFLSSMAASYMALNTDKNVLFLDLNACRMDSRILFNIDNKNCRDIGDLLTGTERIDLEIVKRLSINLENSLNIILPPLSTQKNQAFSKKRIITLIERLKSFFDFLIIDMPRDIYGRLVYGIEDVIDRIAVVVSPDVISVNNADILLQDAKISRSFIDIDMIVNKYNIRPHISPARINNILPGPIKAFIPYDRDIEYLFLTQGPESVFNYNLRIVRDLKEYIKSLSKDE